MLPPTFMVTRVVVQSSVLPKLKRVSGAEPVGSASIHTQCVDVARGPHGVTPQPDSLQLL